MQRFQKALLLRKDLNQQGTTGYRVLNGENDGFPGLILDRYDKTWVIKVYTNSWFDYLDQMLEVIKSEKNVDQVVLRLARNLENPLLITLTDRCCLVLIPLLQFGSARII